jgi:hypothetical protein
MISKCGWIRSLSFLSNRLSTRRHVMTVPNDFVETAGWLPARPEQLHILRFSYLSMRFHGRLLSTYEKLEETE